MQAAALFRRRTRAAEPRDPTRHRAVPPASKFVLPFSPPHPPLNAEPQSAHKEERHEP